MLFRLFLVLTFFYSYTSALDCNALKTKNGTVCVCNSTYCDTVPPLTQTQSNQYQIYRTSKEKLGFRKEIRFFATGSNTFNYNYTAKLNRTKRYQTIVGFGGAFTDSTGINILSLPPPAQNRLLRSYFGKEGISYTLCRFPIGGTDFSLRNYSLDDTPNDTTLKKFKLQPEDFKYRIPFIKNATQLLSQQNKTLNLFGTAWTAPPWMKTNRDWTGVGVLKLQYYQLWADYHLRCIQEYDKLGINVWGLTTGNEPTNGFLQARYFRLNDMAWNVYSASDWISQHLGPTLRKSKYRKTKIMIYDDNMVSLPFVKLMLDNPAVLNYTDGVAVHWYSDTDYPSNFLNFAKSSVKPSVFLINTEACNGFGSYSGTDIPVNLGSWERAENYIANIFLKDRYGSVGWVDWNMVLNMQGGPTEINNFVDSPIIVNARLKVFYKQPMYYSLGHFSKFVIPGSIKLNISLPRSKGILNCSAYLRPDNKIVIVIYNWGPSTILQIQDGRKLIRINLETKSLNTIIYDK